MNCFGVLRNPLVPGLLLIPICPKWSLPQTNTLDESSFIESSGITSVSELCLFYYSIKGIRSPDLVIRFIDLCFC
jgi:hypothetical protein